MSALLQVFFILFILSCLLYYEGVIRFDFVAETVDVINHSSILCFVANFILKVNCFLQKERFYAIRYTGKQTFHRNVSQQRST